MKSKRRSRGASIAFVTEIGPISLAPDSRPRRPALRSHGPRRRFYSPLAIFQIATVSVLNRRGLQTPSLELPRAFDRRRGWLCFLTKDSMYAKRERSREDPWS